MTNAHDPAALEALADRVERATGADRELDALIDSVAYGRRLWVNPNLTVPNDQADYYEKPEDADASLLNGIPLMKECHPNGEWVRGPNGRTVLKNPNRRRPLCYTASLDAAMSLVPEGHAWGVFDDGVAWVWPDSTRDLLRGFQAKAATPALALCAAALRARAALAEAEQG